MHGTWTKDDSSNNFDSYLLHCRLSLLGTKRGLHLSQTIWDLPPAVASKHLPASQSKNLL
jgi:hypothetical protein